MRFIHMADVHLGRCPENGHSWGEDRGKELWDSFAAVIEACNEKQIELLLIAGDLFDHVPLWEDLERVNYFFSTLQETEVVIIAGDKDYVAQDSPWKEFPWKPWVHVLADKYPESVFLEQVDAVVMGCSYQEPVVAKPYLEDAMPEEDAQIQILLGHSGDASHMPADRKLLAERGFDYIALGHLHQPQLFPEDRTAYCGSLEPLESSETGKHGFILGEINENGTNIRLIPFASREYIPLKVRLSGDVTQEELEQRLSEAIRRNGENHIYCIHLEGHFPPHQPLEEGRLLALGNVSRLVNDTTPDYDFMALLEQHQDDLIGMFLEEFLKQPMEKQHQRALYCGLEALLGEKDTDTQA